MRVLWMLWTVLALSGATERAVLTVAEAAEIARIGRNQMYEAVKRGDVYAARIGRSLRIPRVELERFLGIRSDDHVPAA